MNQPYLVPFSYGEDVFVERKSEFIGYIWNVQTEDEAKEKIAQMRVKHRDATHNTYAYIIKEGNIMRYSDDGEPQGTAGMPILEVLRREGVTDVCCVVTRYFGGILLGAGGLVRAYAKGAKIALDSAGIAQMDSFSVLMISLPYNLQGAVQNILPKYDCTIEDIEYGADITITAIIREGDEDALKDALMELSSGTVYPEIIESKYMARKIK